MLYSADISAPAGQAERTELLGLWRGQAETAGIPAAGLDELQARFGRDIALRTPERVAGLLAGAGFDAPVQVFQSLIYRAWVGRTRAEPGAAADSAS